MRIDKEFLCRLRLDRDRRWQTLAVAAWVGFLVAVTLIFLVSPHRVTGIRPYLEGGQHWLDGDSLYRFKPNKGFVYSPLVAVFFSAFIDLPAVGANILWRWISALVLLGGLGAVLRSGLYPEIPRRFYGLIFLLVLPMAAGNIDSGQANPLVAGLLLLALAASWANRWTLVALAVAGAFYWKVYPLTLGMLLILVAPGRLTWRLGLALLALFFLPYLFQNHDYVSRQYQQWVVTRLADNRFQYPIEIAPLDLWFLLVRVGNWPISETAYQILRVGAGAAIAGFCLYGRWRQWSRERLLGGLFALGCVWMLLLGPASESLAYLLLVPVVALGVGESLSDRFDPVARGLVWAAYGFLFLAILRVGFFHHWQYPWALTMQPLGALCFLGSALRRYLGPQATLRGKQDRSLSPDGL